jgi:hypothetical protein
MEQTSSSPAFTIDHYLLNCVISWVDHEMLRFNFTQYQISDAIARKRIIPIAPGVTFTDVDGEQVITDAHTVVYKIAVSNLR